MVAFSMGLVSVFRSFDEHFWKDHNIERIQNVLVVNKGNMIIFYTL